MHRSRQGEKWGHAAAYSPFQTSLARFVHIRGGMFVEESEKQVPAFKRQKWEWFLQSRQSKRLPYNALIPNCPFFASALAVMAVLSLQ
jgi:hypothetical protein